MSPQRLWFSDCWPSLSRRELGWRLLMTLLVIRRSEASLLPAATVALSSATTRFLLRRSSNTIDSWWLSLRVERMHTQVIVCCCCFCFILPWSLFLLGSISPNSRDEGSRCVAPTLPGCYHAGPLCGCRYAVAARVWAKGVWVCFFHVIRVWSCVACAPSPVKFLANIVSFELWRASTPRLFKFRIEFVGSFTISQEHPIHTVEKKSRERRERESWARERDDGQTKSEEEKKRREKMERREESVKKEGWRGRGRQKGERSQSTEERWEGERRAMGPDVNAGAGQQRCDITVVEGQHCTADHRSWQSVRIDEIKTTTARTLGDISETDWLRRRWPTRWPHLCTVAGTAGGVQGESWSRGDDRSEKILEVFLVYIHCAYTSHTFLRVTHTHGSRLKYTNVGPARMSFLFCLTVYLLMFHPSCCSCTVTSRPTPPTHSSTCRTSPTQKPRSSALCTRTSSLT